MFATQTIQPFEVEVIPAILTATNSQKSLRQLRVAAYCRVSTDLEEQQNSFEAQQSHYTDKIMSNPKWTLGGIFADEGLSGTQAKKRPQFLKMIQKCKKDKIDIVLTKSISRFARNTVDCLKYIRLLKQLGIAVIFERENINTLTIESEMMITMMGAFAQAESESISANVSWGQRESMKRGNVHYNFTQWYGYEKSEDGNPQVVSHEAEVVERIYRQFLSGDSIGKIKQALEQDEILTKKGGNNWSPSVIKGILNNEKYCGNALLQKTFVSNCLDKTVKVNNGQLPKYLVKNCHPAIVSRETYDCVQAELARRNSKRKISDKTSKTEQSKYSSKYALTEILICGDCGTPYKRAVWTLRGGGKKAVWRCVNRIDYGRKYCKESPTIEESRLHDAIVKALNLMMPEREFMMDTLMRNMQIVLADNGEDINPFAIENQIEEKQNALLDLVATGLKADMIQDLDSKFKEMSDEIKSLQQVLASYQLQKQALTSVNRQMDDICETLGNATLEITEYNDKNIRQLIETIKVMDRDKLLIVFKGGFEMEVLM